MLYQCIQTFLNDDSSVPSIVYLGLPHFGCMPLSCEQFNQKLVFPFRLLHLNTYLILLPGFRPLLYCIFWNRRLGCGVMLFKNQIIFRGRNGSNQRWSVGEPLTFEALYLWAPFAQNTEQQFIISTRFILMTLVVIWLFNIIPVGGWHFWFRVKFVLDGLP